MKKVLILMIVVCSFGVFAQEDGSATESRLNSIYKKYNATPTSQEVWGAAYSKKNIEEYSVVRGDTLWDISLTIFGDGFFWSKIWSLNPFIKNPHRINPGDKIQFFLGEGMAAPNLQVIKDIAPEKDSSAPKLVTLDDKTLSGVKIPEPKKRSPVPKGWPSSLPPWMPTLQEVKNENMTEINLGARAAAPSSVVLSHFISDGIVDSVGSIVETETDGKFAFLNQYVIIDSESIKAGETYTVVKPKGNVSDPEGGNSDYQLIEVLGQVKAIGKVDDYFKAEVVNMVMPIEVGSILVKSGYRSIDLSAQGSEGKGSGTVIGGDQDIKRNLLSQENIIFINQGKSVGFQEGQDVNIFSIKKNRYSRTELFGDRTLIGKARIVYVENDCATAFVLNASSEIVPGDIVDSGDGNGSVRSKQTDDLDDTDFEDESSGENAVSGEDSLDDDADFEDESSSEKAVSGEDSLDDDFDDGASSDEAVSGDDSLGEQEQKKDESKKSKGEKSSEEKNEDRLDQELDDNEDLDF